MNALGSTLANQMACAIFWACAALVLYAYIGYPIVLLICSRMFGRVPKPPVLDRSALPSVSMIIAAHNEEAVLAERIQNALDSDYPRDRFEVVVASDGSVDRTVEIARQFEERGVRVLNYPVRRGKASTLNDAIQTASGSVIVLSDANTMTDPSALHCLVRWLQCSEVGAVCGRLILTDPVSGKNADGLYWKYENFLKACEGRLRALLGANGAIYALRRNQFSPIPQNTIVDDFVVPLLANLHTNRYMIYDADAVAREETASNVATEFRRRARIGAGGWQAMGILWPLLDLRRGWIAFSFISHKLLRWLCPFFLLGALGTNLALIGRPFFRDLLYAQIVFYTAAIAGQAVSGKALPIRILRLTNMFLMMNAALLVGFFRWAGRPQSGMWSRTPRTSDCISAK